MPTATGSTISTSPSRPACPTGCSAPAATPPSRTSPSAPASASSTTRRSRSSPTSTTTATRISCWPPATQPLLFVNDGKGRFAPVAGRLHASTQPLQGVLTSICDGRLRSRRLPRSSISASTRTSSAPARTRPARRRRTTTPATVRRACCSATTGTGRFVDATKAAGLDAGNDRYHFAAAWADYDERRLARPARRQRLRHQEPLSQPRRARTGTVTLRGRRRTRPACSTTAPA